MVLPRPWPAKVFPRPRIDTTLNQGGTRVHLSNANQLIKTHIIISILYRYRPNCICAEGAGGGCSCFRHGEDPPPPPQAPCNFARPTFEFRCSPLHPKAALHLLFLSSIKIFTELPLSHLPDYLFGQILNDGPCTTWARPTLGTAPRTSVLVTGSPWWRLGWRARASMPSGTSSEPWPRRIRSSKARSLSRRPPSRRSRRRSRRLARPCSR